ncbi:Glutathione transport system permease protein GsiD [Leucobacter soli]|uniref:Glutathione transport system permease protein GsiD n=1 Tax=Leucobacter soli TaxID=2812850 RepID=A0A916NGS0_9MICO|nr:ABC transporter permease [Leucobacter soli]CAG7609656.1 Glutathione transport system permease protein GsiD [Leucobacter soli]
MPRTKRRARRAGGTLGRPEWSVAERIAGLVVLLLACCAIAPGLLAPHEPLAVAPAEAFQSPSPAHPFGTDDSGRDVLSRTIFGARDSLTIGLVATLVALAAGTLLGILAGGSRARALAPLRFVADRLIEALFSFPGLLLALLLIAVRGPGVASVIIAVAVSTAPGYARMVRGGVRQTLGSGPVEAARLQGDHSIRVWARHVLPGAMRPVLVLATLGVGYAVVLAAALGFLGLGSPPPAPEWGAMLNAGRPYLTKAWWLTFFPGLAILAVGIATTMVGRALERGRWSA